MTSQRATKNPHIEEARTLGPNSDYPAGVWLVSPWRSRAAEPNTGPRRRDLRRAEVKSETKVSEGEISVRFIVTDGTWWS